MLGYTEGLLRRSLSPASLLSVLLAVISVVPNTAVANIVPSGGLTLVPPDQQGPSPAPNPITIAIGHLGLPSYIARPNGPVPIGASPQATYGPPQPPVQSIPGPITNTATTILAPCDAPVAHKRFLIVRASEYEK